MHDALAHAPGVGLGRNLVGRQPLNLHNVHTGPEAGANVDGGRPVHVLDEGIVQSDAVGGVHHQRLVRGEHRQAAEGSNVGAFDVDAAPYRRLCMGRAAMVEMRRKLRAGQRWGRCDLTCGSAPVSQLERVSPSTVA